MSLQVRRYFTIPKLEILAFELKLTSLLEVLTFEWTKFYQDHILYLYIQRNINIKMSFKWYDYD